MRFYFASSSFVRIVFIQIETARGAGQKMHKNEQKIKIASSHTRECKKSMTQSKRIRKFPRPDFVSLFFFLRRRFLSRTVALKVKMRSKTLPDGNLFSQQFSPRRSRLPLCSLHRFRSCRRIFFLIFIRSIPHISAIAIAIPQLKRKRREHSIFFALSTQLATETES